MDRKTLIPRDEHDVEQAVRWALAERRPLEVIGHGSKRALGRAAEASVLLDLSALSGVTLYEPEELVLAAQAGTPIADISALLAAHDQHLAFEPVDYAPLLGGAPGRGTIGGVLAANISGPRRITAGAARDHFLGVSAVSGRGERFKSGGRVVKNVTGYDLCKLLAGSWGTLAVMTDVTVKTVPRAATEASLLVLGLDDAAAIHAMAAAMGSSCDVSGAAHLPADVAGRASRDLPIGRAVTALRLEGIAPSVEHRLQLLSDVVKPFGPLAALGVEQSPALWQAIRDVVPFARSSTGGDDAPGEEESAVWRISTAPSNGAKLAGRILMHGEAAFLYDWAGGLVWAALPAGIAAAAGASAMRQAVAVCGGHAMLVRAPAAVRAAAAAAFEPTSDPLAALNRRIKASFDPAGVLNPGRMWALA